MIPSSGLLLLSLALVDLEEQLEAAQRERDQLEEWLRFYSADDVDVDYMLRNFRVRWPRALASPAP